MQVLSARPHACFVASFFLVRSQVGSLAVMFTDFGDIVGTLGVLFLAKGLFLTVVSLRE